MVFVIHYSGYLFGAVYIRRSPPTSAFASISLISHYLIEVNRFESMFGLAPALIVTHREESVLLAA